MRKDCKLQEPYEVAEGIYALLVSKNEQRKYVSVNGGKFRFEPSFTSHQRVSQGAVALASPLGAIVVGGIGAVVSLRDLVETVQIIRNDAGITWCTVPRLMLDVAGLALGSTSLVQGIRGWRASGSLLEWRPAVSPINSRGVPYPDVDVPGYAKVPFPEGPYTPNNTQLRSQFTQAYRLQCKNWWTNQGKPWPTGTVNIHHIKPLQFGGANAFENLVPLPDTVHLHFTSRWRYFVP